MFTSRFLLHWRAEAQVYGIGEQAVDGGNNAGSSLISGLVLDEVGRFFIERYAGDAAALVLQLLQDQVGGVGIGGGVERIGAHFKYDAGIEIEWRLPAR